MNTVFTRVKMASQFTMLPNSLIASGLSLDAIGFMGWLFSKPDDWNFSMRGTLVLMAREGKKIGKDRLSRIVNELIIAGFVSRQIRRRADGKIDGIEYLVSLEKQETINQTASSHEPEPQAVKPHASSPRAGNPHQYNIIKNKEINNQDSCSSPSAPSAPPGELPAEEILEIPPKSLSEPPPKPASGPKTDPMRGFDEFWKAYPRKISKPQALRAWAKALAGTKATQTLPALPPATPERIIAGLRATGFDGEAKFIPHPATWLNGRRWEDVEVSKNDATPEENRIREAERRAGMRWKKACDEWGTQMSRYFGHGEEPKRPVLADFIAEELAA